MNNSMGGGRDSESLPTGWEERFDQSTGWPFYVDHNTKTTSWQDPRKFRRETGQTNEQPQFVKSREIPILREGFGSQQQSGAPSRQPAFNSASPTFSSDGRSSPGAREIPIIRQSATNASGRTGSMQSPTPQNTVPHAASEFGARRSFGRDSTDSPYFSGSPRGFFDPPAGSPTPPPNHPPPQQDGYRSVPIVHEPNPVFEPDPKLTGDENTADSNVAPPYDRANLPDGNLNVDPPNRGRSPSPAPPNLTPTEHIEMILQEAETHRRDVAEFSGKKSEKRYIVIEEMLTRLLIKLDRIDSEGRDEIRSARRDAVRVVQGLLDTLEAKATAAMEEEMQLVPYSESSQNEGEDGGAVKEMTLNSEVAC